MAAAELAAGSVSDVAATTGRPRVRVATWYVAGPMSNLPDFNYPAFHQATSVLRGAGFDVENPAEHNLDPATATYADYLRHGFVKLLRCDGIVLLPGWRASGGAVREANIAAWCGMTIAEWVHDWPVVDPGLRIPAVPAA